MPAEAARASDPATDPALLREWLVIGSLTLPGRPEHVRAARLFVANAISGDHPRAEIVLLLTSELVTNAIVHSRSRLPGGTVGIVVARNAGGLLVTVTDNGSDCDQPVLNSPGGEHGNGLVLVASLADRWGYQHDGSRTTVWFRLNAPALTREGSLVELRPAGRCGVHPRIRRD